MTEEFLYYIWSNRLFVQEISTTDGEPVEIIQPGVRNSDSGPDFFNARIRIGATTWAGNVEMHVRSSDWLRHGHQHDEAYRGVILHVVHEHDIPSGAALPGNIPVVELRNGYDSGLFDKYMSFMESRQWIACARQLRDVDKFKADQWLESLAMERLEKKSARLLEVLEQSRFNWEQAFYEFVARAFGGSVNADTFERLARSLSLNVLAREKNDAFKLEALLFGQAGMLAEEIPDDYHADLSREYFYLQKKYELKPLPASVWKYSKLRPPNFPTLRIAQFARLLHRSASLFSGVVAAESPEALFAMFRVQCDGYWDNHYRFGRTSPRRLKRMGDDTVNLILVNTVVPFLFIYGKSRGIPELCDRALHVLDRLPPEENAIVQKWRSLGLAACNATQTQALLELKSGYCNRRRCLECRIGDNLLRNGEGNAGIADSSSNWRV